MIERVVLGRGISLPLRIYTRTTQGFLYLVPSLHAMDTYLAHSWNFFATDNAR